MAEPLPWRRRGPLARLHAATAARWPSASTARWPRGERLYGVRGLYKPTMSARTIQRLGDVRHALAQRCIAGTLEVHAPFAPKLSEDGQKLVDAGLVRKPPPTSS